MLVTALNVAESDAWFFSRTHYYLEVSAFFLCALSEDVLNAPA